MRINTNTAALNSYNQLNKTNSNLSKSLERLSSGKRINGAADDAAGLAISEKMNSQTRGLAQAQRNAQDGISMIQTAEGALKESHSILQRMRELSVQAANDTNTDDDRAEIQNEISQLTDELDRIGDTTEFNTQKLLDGSLGAKKVPGTDNAAIIGESVGEATSAKATAGSATSSGTSATDVGGYDGTEATLRVDGATITFDTNADDYTAFDDGSAIDSDGLASQLEEDINNAIEEYNNSNNKNISQVSVSSDTGTLSIESGSTGSDSTLHADVEETASTGGLWTSIGYAADTDIDETGSEGELTAGGAGAVNAIDSLSGDSAKSVFSVDGQDIAIDFSADDTDQQNATNALQTAVGSLSAGEDMSTVATALETDLNNAIANHNIAASGENKVEDVTVSVKEGSLVVQSGSEEATSSVKFDNSETAQLLGLNDQSSSTQGGGLQFQIGANQDQAMRINVSDMRSESLDVNELDVTTQDGANDAIETIDNAISQVSSQRSNLGAYQNRLDHTINNLNTSEENLTAAESRISDVDMAREMMNMSKQQILSQAGTAMMAQANQLPQGVLQLLG